MRTIIKTLLAVVCCAAIVGCSGREKAAKEVVNKFTTETARDANAGEKYYTGFSTLQVDMSSALFNVMDEVEEMGDMLAVKSTCTNGDSHEVTFYVQKDGEGEYKIVNSKGLIAAGNTAMYAKAKNIGAVKDEKDLELAKKYNDINAVYDELASSVIYKLTANKNGRTSASTSGDVAYLTGSITINNETGVVIKSATVRVRMSMSVCTYDGSGKISGSTTKTFENIEPGASSHKVTVNCGRCLNVLAFNDGGGRIDNVSIEMSDEDKVACMENYSFTGNEYDEYMASKSGSEDATTGLTSPATSASTSGSTSPSSDFTTENYSWVLTEKADPSQFDGLTKEQLRLVRNYIFAKHGYIFKDHSLGEYFSQFSWYTPVSHDVGDQLNSIEQYNVGVIKSLE